MIAAKLSIKNWGIRGCFITMLCWLLGIIWGTKTRPSRVWASIGGQIQWNRLGCHSWRWSSELSTRECPSPIEALPPMPWGFGSWFFNALVCYSHLHASSRSVDKSTAWRRTDLELVLRYYSLMTSRMRLEASSLRNLQLAVPVGLQCPFLNICLLCACLHVAYGRHPPWFKPNLLTPSWNAAGGNQHLIHPWEALKIVLDGPITFWTSPSLK